MKWRWTALGVSCLAIGFAGLIGSYTALAQTQDGGGASSLGLEEDATCLGCHAPDSMFGKSGRNVVNPDHVAGSVHKDLTCTSCHTGIDSVPHTQNVEKLKVDCISCHVESLADDPKKQADAPGMFMNSVHAGKGRPDDIDLPTCRSCHGPDGHRVRPTKSFTKREIADFCAPCHTDAEKMKRHGVDVEAGRSYFTSFHGKALRYGNTKTATCTDCHNEHAILATGDPNSPANVAKRAATCSTPECHPGAGYNFAMAGTGHLDLTLKNNKVLWWTRLFFLGIATFTFCMLGFFLVLNIRRVISDKLRAHEHPLPPDPKRAFVRWSVAQRLQHALLTLSVTLLVLTGFPMRFPDGPFMKTVYAMLGGIDSARLIHRIAAMGLIAVAVWHIVMLIVLWSKHRTPITKWPMMLGKKDVSDMFNTIMYYIGRRKNPPPFGRYSFREKFDYMAEYWGVPIMVLSGLILWFPAFFSNVFPGEIISIAYIAHGIEATIAACVILVWHMYNVAVVTGARGNKAWLTGLASVEYLHHHHPLEYERVTGEKPIHHEELVEEYGEIPVTPEPQQETGGSDDPAEGEEPPTESKS